MICWDDSEKHLTRVNSTIDSDPKYSSDTITVLFPAAAAAAAQAAVAAVVNQSPARSVEAHS